MYRISSILWLHLKEFFKSPASIILMFVMPIVFSFIFGGMAVNSEIHKPVVNLVVQKGPLTSETVKLLKKNEDFEWVTVSNKQARKNVADQKAVAAIYISMDVVKRMDEKKPIFDILVQRKSEDYLALVPIIEGTANVLFTTSNVNGIEDLQTELLEEVVASEGITIEKEVLKEDRSDDAPLNLMFVGFTIMFMMFGLSGAASTILAERAGGTWPRLMITPISKLEVCLGYLLAYFFMGWLQFAVLMVTITIMFDTSWGNLAYLIPFASLVIISIVGFGLMISGVVKTQQQASALGAILIVSTCMLGGVYWSIDFVPEVMQKVALAVPQSWAMSGFKEIISGSLHGPTLVKDSLVLIGFSALFLTIGLRGIKFE